MANDFMYTTPNVGLNATDRVASEDITYESYVALNTDINGSNVTILDNVIGNPKDSAAENKSSLIAITNELFEDLALHREMSPLDHPDGSVTRAKLADNSVDTTKISDGSVSSAKLGNSGVTAGIYKSVTVNIKGLVTGGTNPTTLAGFGITDGVTEDKLNGVVAELEAQIADINAVRFMNNGILEATKPTVQTVATQYIVSNYSRQPLSGDGLIITFTDSIPAGDKELYIYSEISLTWISAGQAALNTAIADSTTAGITKLYQTANDSNTDGAVSQAGVNAVKGIVDTAVQSVKINNGAELKNGTSVNLPEYPIVPAYETNVGNIVMNGTPSVGTLNTIARANHVHPVDTSRAALASPSFIGTPTAPTAAANTKTTQIATTAFVTNKFLIKSTSDFTTTDLPNGAWGGVY